MNIQTLYSNQDTDLSYIIIDTSYLQNGSPTITWREMFS